jgi:hypothetical protein
MSRTQIPGAQILDGSVQRVDLDAVTAGQAVIKKIVAGTNVTITSTGVDAGTGDVTINATAGSSTPPAVTTVTANTTLTSVTQKILADTTGGTFTITLPTAVGIPGVSYDIKLIAATAVSIATTSAQTIDGTVSPISLARIYSSLTIVSNGTNWYIT